jgi:hypothetical protein
VASGVAGGSWCVGLLPISATGAGALVLSVPCLHSLPCRRRIAGPVSEHCRWSGWPEDSAKLPRRSPEGRADGARKMRLVDKPRLERDRPKGVIGVSKQSHGGAQPLLAAIAKWRHAEVTSKDSTDVLS